MLVRKTPWPARIGRWPVHTVRSPDHTSRWQSRTCFQSYATACSAYSRAAGGGPKNTKEWAKSQTSNGTYKSPINFSEDQRLNAILWFEANFAILLPDHIPFAGQPTASFHTLAPDNGASSSSQQSACPNPPP